VPTAKEDQMLARKAAVLLAVSALGLGALAPSAFGWEHGGGGGGKSKCNSGNGNGSEEITFVVGEHCYGGDPGNSYFNDRGGDEIPTSDGVPNPGGNNVP
jgi:hypothetical protein